jgi:hypothetical protein
MSSHRRLAAVVAALAAVILLTSPALAAKWEFGFTSSGTSASAQTETVCTDNGDGTSTCTSTGVFVFAGKSRELGTPTVHTEQVCYNESSNTFDNETGEPISFTGLFGCADTDAISVDNLSLITLAPTEISLVEFACDVESCTEEPDGTVVVAGTWTGIGPIVSQTSMNRLDDGLCVQVDSQRGMFRQAEFSGTVDGDPLATESADVSEGTFSFRTTCAFEE